MSDFNEKKDAFGAGGSFQPQNGDLEGRRGSTTVQGRKMSRIGPPVKMGSIPGGSDEDDEHGRLVAMEADNAIQYRTCSWQMVRSKILLSESQNLWNRTDGGAALL